MDTLVNIVLLLIIVYLIRTLYLSYKAPNIIPEEIPMLKKETKGKMQIIDVRSARQFNKDHIKGSKNIQYGNVLRQQNKLPKDKKIIIVSQRGTQTGRIIANLIKEGFDVVNLKGGFSAWTKYQKD